LEAEKCKGFEQCVGEETNHLAILKSKSISVVNLHQETAEMAEKSSWEQANRRQLVWFGEI
jgi:hypothetical protein